MTKRKSTYTVKYWDEDLHHMDEWDYEVTSPEAAVRKLYNQPIEDIGGTEGVVINEDTGERWEFVASYNKSQPKHIGVKLTKIRSLATGKARW